MNSTGRQLLLFAALLVNPLLNAFQPASTETFSRCFQLQGMPSDHAPSWDTLSDNVLATKTGSRLAEEANQREKGIGPPHTDASVRLFSQDEKNTVRVTLFRDHAAWCPYCQKVWLFLELKEIPYRCEKANMNAYGDKPSWYTRKVDGGKLPAIELDGELYVESLDIMKLLEEHFPDHGPIMVPSVQDTGVEVYKRYEDLLQLDKELQSAWFSLTFYPIEGEALVKANQTFLETLAKVDRDLGATDGAWFLGGDMPSLVDIQFITQVERIIPSVLYWKGLAIRDTQFPNLDRWLAAFESIPAYLASRSDYYTHIMVIPSQNGPGCMIPDAKPIANQICGLSGGAWQFPISPESYLENFPELKLKGLDYHPAHEAAYKLIQNHANIVEFSCRGAGEQGRPAFHAELADPYAEPNEGFFQPVDVSLRHVAHALLEGEIAVVKNAALKDLQGQSGNDELRENWEAYPDETDKALTYYWNYETGDVTWTPPTRQLDTCLAYLRDRIGVPRDMGPAAAMHFRAQLNWAIELMNGGPPGL